MQQIDFARLLPKELVAIIIVEAWCSPLTLAERLQMYLSSTLVSRIWAWEFFRVYFKDVHLLSPHHVSYYFGNLHNGQSIFFSLHENQDEHTPRTFAQTITFHIQDIPDERCVEPYLGIHDYLHYAPKIDTYFSKLSQFALVYHNCLQNDNRLGKLRLPPQVKALSVMHTFDLQYGERRHQYMASAFQPNDITPLPHIEDLCVIGANASLMTGLAHRLPLLKRVTHNCSNITSIC